MTAHSKSQTWCLSDQNIRLYSLGCFHQCFFPSSFHLGTVLIHNALFKMIMLHLNTLHFQLKTAGSHTILVIHLVNSTGLSPRGYWKPINFINTLPSPPLWAGELQLCVLGSVEKKKQHLLFWLGKAIVNFLFLDIGRITFLSTKISEVTLSVRLWVWLNF